MGGLDDLYFLDEQLQVFLAGTADEDLRCDFLRFVGIGDIRTLKLQTFGSFDELQGDFSLINVLLVDGFEFGEGEGERFLLLLTGEGHRSEQLLLGLQGDDCELGLLLAVDLQVVAHDDALALHGQLLPLCRLHPLISDSNQTKTTYSMRIGKKDRVDVRKFMEDVKANRTNRSYTSLEHPRRPATEHEPQYTSKYRPESNEPFRPTQQTQRFSYEQPRYAPVYAAHPHPYPMAAEYAPSQHFTASPPYHAGLFNYSQSYNSQAYPMHRQDSARYEQQFGAEMGTGYQPSRAGSKLVTPPTPLQRTGSLQQLPNPISKTKAVSPEPIKIRESLEKPICMEQSEKKEVEEVKLVPQPAKKKRKPKKKNDLNDEPVAKQDRKEKKEKKGGKQESKEEEKEVIAVQGDVALVQGEEMNTASISRRFDEILAAERVKLQARVVQQANFQRIMTILNDKLTPIFNTHFTPTTMLKLTTLQQQLSQFGKLETRDFIFEEEVGSFEKDMMEQMRMLA